MLSVSFPIQHRARLWGWGRLRVTTEADALRCGDLPVMFHPMTVRSSRDDATRVAVASGAGGQDRGVTCGAQLLNCRFRFRSCSLLLYACDVGLSPAKKSNSCLLYTSPSPRDS